MRLRPALVVWHRWFGLLAAAWLTLLSLTGSALVFYDELDTLLNPDQRRVATAGRTATIASVVDAAETRRLGSYASFVDLANRPGETTRVFLAARADNPSGFEVAHIFVDPATGGVVGERTPGRFRFDRRHVMELVYGLHVDLLLGGSATWVLGLLAALWAADHLVGAVLALPQRARWWHSFSVRRSASGWRRTFDLHRAGGLWLFPFTLMLATTGAYFNWYDYFEDAATVVSHITPRYSETVTNLPAPDYDMPVAIDAAVTAVRAASAGAEVDMIAVLPAKGVYEARVFDARDIDPYGRRLMTVDGRTGQILEDRHVTDGSAADVFFAWQYPLHSGKAFGWPGRLTVFVVGLAVAGLNLTGVLLWWRRRQVRP